MADIKTWFTNNDMLVSLSGLRSSTAVSTGWLNSSTGVTVDIWNARTTGSTANLLVDNLNMPYVTGSNGNYRVAIQSTAVTPNIISTSAGMAIVTVAHSGLDAEWRVLWRAAFRGTA